MIRKNIISFFRAPYSVATMLLVAALMMWMFTRISDYPLLRGNFGKTGFMIEVTIQIVLSLLFGLFLGLQVFRYRYFAEKKFDPKTDIIGFLGAIFGSLVVGCPTCGFTLASALGLVGFLGFLPMWGQELKYIGIFFLLVANYLSLRDLTTCKLKKSKKISK